MVEMVSHLGALDMEKSMPHERELETTAQRWSSFIQEVREATQTFKPGRQPGEAEAKSTFLFKASEGECLLVMGRRRKPFNASILRQMGGGHPHIATPGTEKFSHNNPFRAHSVTVTVKPASTTGNMATWLFTDDKVSGEGRALWAYHNVPADNSNGQSLDMNDLIVKLGPDGPIALDSPEPIRLETPRTSLVERFAEALGRLAYTNHAV